MLIPPLNKYIIINSLLRYKTILQGGVLTHHAQETTEDCLAHAGWTSEVYYFMSKTASLKLNVNIKIYFKLNGRKKKNVLFNDALNIF